MEGNPPVLDERRIMRAFSDFSPDQIRCLHALLEALIPPDDWPGAVDAGVVDYLDRLLAEQPETAAVYKIALALLDEETTMSTPAHASFADLDPAARTALLVDIEAGSTKAEWPFSPSWFISMAATHAAEGYYSDPANGGNRDGVGWKMVGFEVSDKSVNGEAK